jgi:hypothetical protein
MAESATWNLDSPEQEEAFLFLVLRYLDGLATRQEMGRLNDALRLSSACRDFFVQVTSLQGAIREALAPLRFRFKPKKRAPRQALAQSDSLKAVPAGAGPAGPSLPGQAPAAAVGSGRDKDDPSEETQALSAGGEAAKDTKLKLSGEDTISTKRPGASGSGSADK